MPDSSKAVRAAERGVDELWFVVDVVDDAVVVVMARGNEEKAAMGRKEKRVEVRSVVVVVVAAVKRNKRICSFCNCCSCCRFYDKRVSVDFFWVSRC